MADALVLEAMTGKHRFWYRYAATNCVLHKKRRKNAQSNKDRTRHCELSLLAQDLASKRPLHQKA
jgi:hypothetical protein